MISRAVWLVPVAFLGLVLPPSACRDRPDTADDRAKLLSRLGADRWHQAGDRGRGVKVLVIDSGFRGWRGYLGAALPSTVLARAFRADASLETRDSLHGVRCGEVIHSLAPEAELIFANWEPEDSTSFVRAVQWGREQGARVVSCSVIMPGWSDGEGGGPIHAALTRIVGDGNARTDLLAVACAGNTAQRHWTGRFHRGAGGFHEWAPGQTISALTPWGNERVSVELSHPHGANFVLEVIDADTGTAVGRSTVEIGECSAVARFLPSTGVRYAVRVGLPSAEPPGTGREFHVAVLGGWLEHSVARGSVPFPADGPEFVAVGAVDGSHRRASYSSCGPNGSRPKPDFVAEVPVWTAAPGGSFSGTSAAAPQAAGLAALILGRHPDWSPNQVRDALRRAAVDIDPPGHDFETGYGLLRLPKPD
jgi:subtilisin family serine protease